MNLWTFGLVPFQIMAASAKLDNEKTRILVSNAISSKAVELLRKYHEKGIDITVCSFGELNGATSVYFAATSVYFAAKVGHCDVIRLLIEVGADVNTANIDGATPVFIAAQNGHCDVIRFLHGSM